MCSYKKTLVVEQGDSPYRDHQVSKIILVSGGRDMPFRLLDHQNIIDKVNP